MPFYKVRYHVRMHARTRTVTAKDENEARENVKNWVHAVVQLPMFMEDYRVLGLADEDSEQESGDEKSH